MVVTIAQPVDTGPFGPGFLVQLDSTFIGPLPSGSFWRVDIASVAVPETFLVRDDFPTASNSAFWPFLTAPTSQLPFPFANKDLVHGNPMKLLAELRSPTAVLDSLQIDIVWDMTSGVPYVMQQVLQNMTASSPTALAIAEETNAAVHMDFGDLGRFGLGQLLNGIPQIPMRRILISPDRTGEGSLTHPVGPFDLFAFGLTWQFVSRPPGAGSIEGAPDRTARRALDLRLVARDIDANEYTYDSGSFNEDLRYMTFNPLQLTRIEYWIEPGTTVRFWWLGLP